MKSLCAAVALSVLVFGVAVPPALAAPRIEVQAPAEGSTVQGVVVVKYDVKDFQIVDFTKDPTVAETKGHIHIQLDDNPVNTIHTVSDVWVFAGVKPGPHTLKLWLARSNHTPLTTPVETTIHFTEAAK